MLYSISNHYILNKLVGFTYNKDGKASNYIYRRNIQGDIIGIYDSLGNEVGGYAYDAYGKCYVKYKDNSSEEEKTILNTNPFRYRGYYYDNETGLYYLNARYYDPNIGRFISPDVLTILDETKGQINGLNLYMYCNNNPIMYVDPSGCLPKWVNWILGGILIVGSIALTIATAGLGGVIASAIGNGIWAAIAGGALAGGIVGAASGALLSAGTQIISNGIENFSWAEVGKGALTGLITGAIAGGIFGGITHVYSSEVLANAASGLDAAKYELKNSLGTLRSVKNLSKLPFGNSNIIKAVVNAAVNYNNAYANYIAAKSMYEILRFGFSAAYFIGESYFSDWLGKYM